MHRDGDGTSGVGDTTQDLDFEHADYGGAEEPGGAGPLVCGICKAPISDTYFTWGGAIVCARCEGPAREAGPGGSALTRFLGAVAAGSVAAIIGSAFWMLITTVTGYEIGLIAIAVGWIVGVAIQIGNRGVGGLPYQLAAVFLTYTAIVMTYVPMLATQLEASWTEPASERLADANDAFDLEGGELGEADDAPMSNEAATTAAWVVAIPIAYAVPFLSGFENAIGILIIGFALYQSWRMTTKRQIQWGGPFQVGGDGVA